MIEVQKDDIRNLIQSGEFEEGIELEAKTARDRIPANLWETISAFMNTSGGVIVLGLEESGSDWLPVGVNDALARVQDFRNNSRNQQVISAEGAGPDDVWIETIDNKSLIVVRIQPAPRNRRPVFTGGDRRNSFFRRNEGDYRCSDTEIDRMVREASSTPYDRTVPPEFSITDIDSESLEIYRELSMKARPQSPHRSLNTEEYLRQISAYHTDRNTGRSGPTISGLLMLGTASSIQDIRRSHVIDYRRVPANAVSETRWTDRVRWTGNLLGAYLEIFPRLVRGLPSPFYIERGYRRDNLSGLESLREAFVNLLVHTDYDDSRDSIILHEDAGYVFHNPGNSWVDPRDLGKQYANERRNPGLALLFDNIGLAEQAGSGFARIYDEWSRLGYDSPIVQSDEVRYEFSLRLDLESAFSNSERELLDKLGGRRTRDETVAILHAFRHGSVSNHELRELIGQGTLEASRTLTRLRDEGVFSHIGTGRNSQYALRNAPQQLTLTQSLSYIGENEDVSPEVSAISGSNWSRDDLENTTTDSTRSSVNSGRSSVNSGRSSVNSGRSSVNSGRSLKSHDNPETDSNEKHGNEDLTEDDFPQHIRDAINSVVSTRWSRSSQTREVVLAICGLQPTGIKQLAALLSRSEDSIRTHVRALLKAGQLEPTESSQNHPRQQYRTNRKIE